jgi:hypothetical protein
MLREVYVNYGDQHEKAPSRLEDLLAYITFDSEGRAYGEVSNGELVLVWDLNFLRMPRETWGNTVLGYEKEVPTEGGSVLMADGTVRQMTAQEFEAALKANPKPP